MIQYLSGVSGGIGRNDVAFNQAPSDLAQAVDEADIRVLLMCLVHLTGDMRWLASPFSPKRDVRLIPDPRAGLPDDVCAQVRAAALDLLQQGSQGSVITDPGDALIHRMMSVCLGEAVPPQYAPLVREEMGIIPREARWPDSQVPEDRDHAQVLIVGAGVCAIALGVALGRLGIPYQIVEKNPGLGGTWYVNRYPGCGVDTPNHSYSFSFGRRYRWSRYFSHREEILDYLKRTAEELGVRSNIRFRTRLLSARWDGARRRWISIVEDGDGLLRFLKKDPAWPHPERAVNRINDRHRQELTDFILSELGERTDLIEQCVPSYPPYGKRILLDNGWYRTLLKPNVALVTTPIRRITQDAVLTSDGAVRPADIIVYSTGFKVTEMAARLNITGRRGLSLADIWANDDPRAYLGLTVPGFPNFFCMLGPNSGPGHGGSVIFQAECQARYITACLVQMISQKIDAIDVRSAVADSYLRKVDAEHETLIWTHPGMSTYYRNKHGRVFSVMPWRFVDYWRMTHDPDLADYETMP